MLIKKKSGKQIWPQIHNIFRWLINLYCVRDQSWGWQKFRVVMYCIDILWFIPGAEKESGTAEDITSVHRVLSVYPGFRYLLVYIFLYSSSFFSAPVSVKKDEANLLDLQASKPLSLQGEDAHWICIDARQEGKGRLISWRMWSEFQKLLTDPCRGEC